jgi:hypothetical protein
MSKHDYLPPDKLPPHSPDAEEAILACCLLKPDLIEEQCRFVRPETFYDLRRARIWMELRDMAQKRRCIDLITLQEALQKKKALKDVGGIEYLSALTDRVATAANVRYYLNIALEKFALRKTLEVCATTSERIYEYEGDLDSFMLGVRADIETVTSIKSGQQKEPYKVWTLEELNKWDPPEHLRLVGDNEICMGYEGMVLIAGPGSSGKSLCAASLALAGAQGEGLWMGRKVHRQFKTLIVQAENGAVRLKQELEEMARLHPKVDINGHIFIFDPPEGGLPFHKPEFRVFVRRQVEALKPALVILDPWSQVAADDSAKDVVDKLAEIRSCFPSGDDCPGLLIIAHTKKPRPEDVRRGRALTNLVSGSIALPNTCRCVYLLLPWDEELTEERIYWACSKLNNGQMYAPSVWKRRFGTFFEHDSATDPREWGIEPNTNEPAHALIYEDLVSAYATESVLSKATLVKRLEEQTLASNKTIYRAIGPGGYLSEFLEPTESGWLKLKPKPARARNNSEEDGSSTSETKNKKETKGKKK